MVQMAHILTRATIETADGQESVWATSALDIPCWVYEVTPTTATLGPISGALGIAEVFSVRLPIGTVVLSGDHLIVAGLTYDVQHTNDETTYAPWLDCACRKLA